MSTEVLQLHKGVWLSIPDFDAEGSEVRNGLASTWAGVLNPSAVHPKKHISYQNLEAIEH